MLILLVLEVMISTVSAHAWDRYTEPESVVSICTVGTDPVTCTSKDGDDVIDKDDTAESITIAVFLQPTAVRCVAQKGSPIETALILPEILIVVFLHPNTWTV